MTGIVVFLDGRITRVVVALDRIACTTTASVTCSGFDHFHVISLVVGADRRQGRRRSRFYGFGVVCVVNVDDVMLCTLTGAHGDGMNKELMLFSDESID